MAIALFRAQMLARPRRHPSSMVPAPHFLKRPELFKSAFTFFSSAICWYTYVCGLVPPGRVRLQIGSVQHGGETGVAGVRMFIPVKKMKNCS